MRKGNILTTASLGLLILATEAMASVSGGTSRIPFTDFFVELYSTTNNVYVPLIALAAVVIGAAGLATGALRIGPVLGRILMVVGLLGLTVTGIGQTIGANAAIGWLL